MNIEEGRKKEKKLFLLKKNKEPENFECFSIFSFYFIMLSSINLLRCFSSLSYYQCPSFREGFKDPIHDAVNFRRVESEGNKFYPPSE